MNGLLEIARVLALSPALPLFCAITPNTDEQWPTHLNKLYMKSGRHGRIKEVRHCILHHTSQRVHDLMRTISSLPSKASKFGARQKKPIPAGDHFPHFPPAGNNNSANTIVEKFGHFCKTSETRKNLQKRHHWISNTRHLTCRIAPSFTWYPNRSVIA